MIYEHLSHMFKAYSGALVSSDLRPSNGDLFVFDTGAWYSIPDFRGERICQSSILELEAAPWTHQNLAHFFYRTPARHLLRMHPQLLDECINDMCLRAGHIHLSMRYHNHRIPVKHDALLFNTFARYARKLTISVAYHGVLSDQATGQLAVIDDLARVFKDEGCRANTLALNLHFDTPPVPTDLDPSTQCGSQDDATRPNLTWIQHLISQELDFLNAAIELCIYSSSTCTSRKSQNIRKPRSIPRPRETQLSTVYDHDSDEEHACAPWNHHFFSMHSRLDPKTDQWSCWRKEMLSPYEAAALEWR